MKGLKKIIQRIRKDVGYYNLKHIDNPGNADEKIVHLQRYLLKSQIKDGHITIKKLPFLKSVS